MSLQQNVHKLEGCLNQNDLSGDTGLENCVKIFVNEFVFRKSDFHTLPSPRHVNKSKRHIGNVDRKQELMLLSQMFSSSLDHFIVLLMPFLQYKHLLTITSRINVDSFAALTLWIGLNMK